MSSQRYTSEFKDEAIHEEIGIRISDAVTRKLKQVFRDDVENLQRLIQRDLSSWL